MLSDSVLSVFPNANLIKAMSKWIKNLLSGNPPPPPRLLLPTRLEASSTGTVVPALTLPLLRVTAESRMVWDLLNFEQCENVCKQKEIPFQEMAQAENAMRKRAAGLKPALN